MADSFSFNGIRKSYIKTVLKGRNTQVIAPIEHQLVKVPKRAGALLMGASTNIRELTVPVWIKKPQNMTFSRLKEDLASWLVTSEPAELKFDNDRERTYFAKLSNIDEPEIINSETATTTIHFICPDPYKYSDEKRVFMPIIHPQFGISPIRNVDVLGNINTYPIVRVDVKRKLNFFALISKDDHFQIGSAETVDVPTYEPEKLVFIDDMTTLMGWTQANNVDNGYVSGSIASSGNYFYPESFGTVIQPPMWQGPSLKKSIGKALKDFKAQINVQFFNTPAARTGMMEIYFLNAANETVAKIGLEDRFAATNNIFGKARIGTIDNGTWLLNSGADNPEWWDNYTGILRIERKNNWWTVYFSTVDENGVHTYPKGSGGFLTLHDAGGRYASEVTQVQVSFRMYPDTEKSDMRVHDIQIWELNEPPEPASLPVIALPGDTLEFDHYKNTVRRNGEIIQKLKEFGSNFFALKPGRNRLYYLPSDAGDVTLTYREKYL